MMRFIRRTLRPAGRNVKQARPLRGATGCGAIVAIARSVTEVSARLRAARERAGLTIEEISASTKISAATLAALERGDFARLPGDFYTRAFLRTYARELGLPPQSIVEEYDAERKSAEPPPGEPRDSLKPAPITDAPLWPRFAAVAGNGGVVIALVVVLLAVAVARSRPDATRAPEQGAVATTGAGAPVPAPAAAAAPRDVSPEKLTIEIQAAAPIWVTGAADGKRVLYRLLAPGERVTVEARNDAAFRVGDAAAFTYSINGVAGKPLGGPGEVRDVQITRENYRTFQR